jgi:hypothetical protein
MRVLGIVDWVNNDRDGHPIAGVIPLYDVTQAEEWRAVRSTEFPTQGQVFWFQAHAAQNALRIGKINGLFTLKAALRNSHGRCGAYHSAVLFACLILAEVCLEYCSYVQYTH